MDPLLVARSLQYYKRREVQEAILAAAKDREVSPRYGEGFGKRPDILSYPTDVLEFAKRKATSFHCSEERWSNPLNIKTGASRKEMNELRTGWDLVLDIDAKDWDISRLTAWLFIEALKSHGIKNVNVKFSGNKGWHIGVPWESFPKSVLDASGNDIETKDLFPELPRAIASYLLEYIGDVDNGLIIIDQDKVIFGDNVKTFSIRDFTKRVDKPIEALLETFCTKCQKIVKEGDELYFLFCNSCGYKGNEKYEREKKEMLDDKFLVCPKCKHPMDFTIMKEKSCPHSKNEHHKKFKLNEVIQFDTILLAGRHLYRMPYSLHEKSGLASVVVEQERVLEFNKKDAEPANISFNKNFLHDFTPGEAERLLHNAWNWQQQKEESSVKRNNVEFEIATEAIPEEHFPPCMKNILEGMADGKKRAMFALTNFLAVAGWTPEMIEKRLYEWNEKNATKGEPLRDVIIKGHMHQVKMKKERILPPNCKSFYQELGVCKPDEFCSRIKNPGPYALKHAKLGEKRKRVKKEANQA